MTWTDWDRQSLRNAIAKQERQTELKAKIDRAETWLSIANLIAVILCAILIFSASWMAENWFSYERTTQKTVEEPYEYVVDRISTYVCYVTRTGECYHADGCRYLKSKYETTVYEAKRDGYRACSRCDVTERTTLAITETRYRTVTKMITETVEPKWPVFFGGCGMIFVLYFIAAWPTKKRIEAANKELNSLRN